MTMDTLEYNWTVECSGTREDATSDTRRRLTDVQEETLIKYINKLSDRGLPPTPQIVKTLAEEII